jgi:hypothetical protein
LFPGRIEVAKGIDDLEEILAASKQAIGQGCTLYEAAFAINGGYGPRRHPESRRARPAGFD